MKFLLFEHMIIFGLLVCFVRATFIIKELNNQLIIEFRRKGGDEILES
jgi:hypothetical protein